MRQRDGRSGRSHRDRRPTPLVPRDPPGELGGELAPTLVPRMFPGEAPDSGKSASDLRLSVWAILGLNDQDGHAQMSALTSQKAL